jgi:hypothetical protein
VPNITANARDIMALRRELARAERVRRDDAEREARRLAKAEHVAWREVQDACFLYDYIRANVNKRLEAIRAGERERFHNEVQLAEMALKDAEHAGAAYTIISFARLAERLRYLRGGSEREVIVREALERGGVYTNACGGRHFQEIAR